MAIAQRRRPRNLVSRVVCVVTLGVLVLVASPAGARITKIQITAKESPTFGGYSWPGVGQYEKIVGKAFGEVDPERSEERRHRRHRSSRRGTLAATSSTRSISTS